MNRGVDHQAVFFADDDRLEFGRLLQEIHAEMGVWCHAYCLMGNHFHLLVQAPSVDLLSEGMQHLSSVFTQRVNRRVGRDGPLFRGRFHSIPVETDAYLLRATRYIHRNPLDLPGVSHPRDYRWSSHQPYLGLRPVPSFLDTSLVTSVAGGRRGLIDLIEGDPALPADDLCPLVRLAVAVDHLVHPSAPGHDQRLDRTLMVLLSSLVDDERLRTVIDSELGTRSSAAMAAARRRAALRLRSDERLRRMLEWLEGELVATKGV